MQSFSQLGSKRMVEKEISWRKESGIFHKEERFVSLDPIVYRTVSPHPHHWIEATFANDLARPGKVAFISHSGALCTSILDWNLQANVSFSVFVSIGSMMDVSWGDIIYYLGDDTNTKAIAMYLR